MAIEHIFDSASRVMTVISFITFAGIWAWAWSARKQKDFSEAAQLPFTEKDEEKQNV
ncbi:cytochrome c oxidase cbb3-type subunit 4 [Pseudoduganella flava]|uniref:CcoQ/FixQ family Cbb3-type cytochrome c oxidase assembly chaperone n=1 Tax=Pseudoduganella flava TaxID=871742 RepID=A0A562PH09_9BURK|nr:CcoQ/FixQ family Cbb3-type cytochrome c oxidase assembly chaperone [Pseudoduganella flava]QGZ40341.1 CcoQ/FixQ family Cbb3-type cytochrome c oxidase assembly chaperone [Pseudoduganella flava]TWI43530.1 cytochrome c oxidase cbb3-type subunit 4 [Pseudoduganella flava]